MKRSTPLKRKTWMRKRSPRRLKRAGSDPARLQHARDSGCAVAHGAHGALGHYDDCYGPIEAAHLRHHTGLGLKEPDRNSIGLCRKHHREFDGHFGCFYGWKNLDRFAWFTRVLAPIQAAWEAKQSRREATNAR